LPLKSNELNNLENISLNSPKTVITFPSSQATYNTNALAVNYNTEDQRNMIQNKIQVIKSPLI